MPRQPCTSNFIFVMTRRNTGLCGHGQVEIARHKSLPGRCRIAIYPVRYFGAKLKPRRDYP